MSFLPNALNLISLLPTAIICGAWWYAATQKRNVAIFYWLAATHTLALVIRTLQMFSTMGGGRPDIARLQSMGAASTVVAQEAEANRSHEKPLSSEFIGCLINIPPCPDGRYSTVDQRVRRAIVRILEYLAQAGEEGDE